MGDRVKVEIAPSSGDRVAELERKVEGLDRTVCELSRRLEALEAQRAGPAAVGAPSRPGVAGSPGAAAATSIAATAAAVAEIAAAAPRPAPAAAGPSLATLVGRTCIVLGGAFLLRALTQGSWNSGESGVGELGVGVGIAYAAIWLVLAHRAGKAGRVHDASAHGMATAIIAFPLIWEATTRFQVLPPPPWPGSAAPWWRRPGATTCGC